MFERLVVSLLLLAIGVTAHFFWQQRFMERASAATGSRTQPTVLYFRSDSCAPCATQWRLLQQIEAEFSDKVAIEKIDADTRPDVAARYGIFTVPTTLVVDASGVVRHANYGLAPARKLAAQLRDVANRG